MTITIQLIRHGITKGNLEKRFIGCRTDEPLCTQGIEEIKKLTDAKIYNDSNLIFSSPLKRCIETAKLIFPHKEINIIENFKEIDFGLFENLNHKELNGNKSYQRWIDSNGTDDLPCGEKLKDFADRTMDAFDKMIKVSKGKNVSAVAHGGTIMAIISALKGGNFYDYFCQNGHGYIFDYSAEDKKIFNLRKI